MTAGLYRASELEIQKLLDDPISINELMERATWAPPVREVRPKGLGYSVLQALDPAQARQFAGFLRSLSREMLQRRFDPQRMTALQISPGVWDVADSRLDHVLSSYEDLRSFVDSTVETRSGLIVYVT